jgi:hypothetical protein
MPRAHGLNPMSSLVPLVSHSSFLSLALLIAVAAGPVRAAGLSEDAIGFVDRHCSSCHNDVDKEGGLDLTTLAFQPGDAANFTTWVKVHDRVQSGDMPPKEKKRPAAAERRTFVGGLASNLIAFEKEKSLAEGRATRRRLNRAEYENALRDILNAPWLQIQGQLPEDGEAFRFNKVSAALDVSYVHMTRYMAAADYALRQAMAVELTHPPTTKKRYYARDEGGLTTFWPTFFGPMPERMKIPVLDGKAQTEVRRKEIPVTVGDADPEVRNREAVGWISSNYVTGFGSRWTNFRAPVAGRYRVRFSGYTIWVGGGGSRQMYKNGQDPVGEPEPPKWFRPDRDQVSEGRRNEPISIYAQGTASNRHLGGFDLEPEPQVRDVGEVWLLGNEFLVTDSSRFFRSRPTGFQGEFTNPLSQRDGMPGVAFQWMEVEGPLYDETTRAGYRLLFGDLPLKKVAANEIGVPVESIKPVVGGGRGRGRGQVAGGGGFGAQAGMPPDTDKVEVVSTNPPVDAERLLRGFMQRVYRQPVQESDVQLFLALIKERMEKGLGFAGAMLSGYTAVLSSPQFVFLDERPGRLDDAALATRLALFLWNSEPDPELRARAARGELHRPEVLQAETQRMLADPRSDRFVNAFLDYWIDIRKMEETTPSTTLYNDYYLDDSLAEAALAETRLYFSAMLHDNLPARHIVDSNFTFLNERLAVHYGIPGVEGVAMRRVNLPAESVRGGLMTQASVLKVTANGTTTSPVLRGKWIMERIVGYEIPLPPAAVPAVEPDIRGATTIREQLDKHRADESCAMCHRKIDPPGFALESFDVMGGWRDRYRATAVHVAPVPGFGKNGWPFAFYYAMPVDASGQTADGRPFRDVREFKRLLLQDEAQLARNLVRQMTVFATGAPVRFSDREKIEQILERVRPGHFGVRDLVHELVQSELFLTK